MHCKLCSNFLQSFLSHTHTLAHQVHLGKSRSLCFTFGRALVKIQPRIISHHQVAFGAMKSSFYLLWLAAKEAQQLGRAPSRLLTPSTSCRKSWHLQKSITNSAETEELYLWLLSHDCESESTIPTRTPWLRGQRGTGAQRFSNLSLEFCQLT